MKLYLYYLCHGDPNSGPGLARVDLASVYLPHQPIIEKPHYTLTKLRILPGQLEIHLSLRLWTKSTYL